MAKCFTSIPPNNQKKRRSLPVKKQLCAKVVSESRATIVEACCRNSTLTVTSYEMSACRLLVHFSDLSNLTDDVHSRSLDRFEGHWLGLPEPRNSPCETMRDLGKEKLANP